jgi:hypothetical protein
MYRNIWTSRLPAYLQTPLLCLTDSTLDSAAAFADRLIQSLPSPSLNLTSLQLPTPLPPIVAPARENAALPTANYTVHTNPDNGDPFPATDDSKEIGL